MSTGVAVSALFLPERLQLGPNNWLEFKFAIETILRTRDIPLAHLTSLDRPLLYDPRTKSSRVSAPDAANQGQAMDDLNERWTAEDELCKAAIMLNVRPEHMRLAEYEHEQWTAGELWDALTRLDTQIREDEERKWLALRRACRVLLGMLFVLTVLVLYEVRFGSCSEL